MTCLLYPISRIVSDAVRKAFIGIALLTAAATPAPAADGAYELGVQDRLRIHVYEWPALTGEFTIGPKGRVALPLIGEVDASGIDTSALAKSISERLKAKASLNDLPDVAVDVLQYRPFYILGRVERAGEYAYRPGMIVLNAVSIAGGIYRRPQVSDWAAERDAISSGSDLQMHVERMQELAAREIRLRAEVDDLAEMPRSAAAGPPAVERFETAERAIFDARRKQFDNNVKVLTDRVELYRDEIKALKEQGLAEGRERLVIVRELNDVKELVSRGLTPAPRVLPLERGVAQIDREIKENEAFILRAMQQINISEQMLATLRDERRTAAVNDLKAVQSLMSETRERYRMAKRIIEGSESVAVEEEANSDQESTSALAFSITRVNDGKPHVVAATETTPMLPGDIVNVLRRGPSGSELISESQSVRGLSETASTAGEKDLFR